MKKYAIFLILLGYVLFATAQDIEVKKFEPLEKDQTAALRPRKDINGVTCGLVKVVLKEPGAEFEGSVMGDVQFTGSEYLVYLPNGTKRLGIKHPDYLPTTIVFADYGTKKVASSTTYELEVKANKKKAKVDNSKKGIAVFNIKPSNAMLLIDGQIVNGSGGAYTLSLPYGTHYYTVKLKDYELSNILFEINDNAITKNIDLNDFFSYLYVSCQTKDSEIYIDGEYKGVEKWSSHVPPKTYNINVQKEGYHTFSKTVEINEYDSICIDLPQLDVVGGTLIVNYQPDNCFVWLDDRLIGETPLVFNSVSEGVHNVTIRKDNYVLQKRAIEIYAGQTLTIDGNLELTDLGYLITHAEEGDVRSQWLLGICYIDNKKNSYFERNDKFNGTKNRPVPFQERNIEKAIFWFEKAASATSKDDVPISSSKKDLCTCYILKGDYAKSFYWAERSSDSLLKAFHFFYGIGTEKNTSKAAGWLMKEKTLIERYGIDENELQACRDGMGNPEVVRQALSKLRGWIGEEIYLTITQ